MAGYLIRELFHDRRPVLHSDGEQRRDFVYVDDLINLALRVRESLGFDCVNVSTNETHSINEMYRTIAKIMGKERIQAIYEEPSHYWHRYPGLYEGAYPISSRILDGEVTKHTLCDNAHAAQKYGWTPKVIYEDGLRNTVEFAVKVLGRS